VIDGAAILVARILKGAGTEGELMDEKVMCQRGLTI